MPIFHPDDAKHSNQCLAVASRGKDARHCCSTRRCDCADRAYIRPHEIKAQNSILIIYVGFLLYRSMYIFSMEQQCYYTIHAGGKECWNQTDSTSCDLSGIQRSILHDSITDSRREFLLASASTDFSIEDNEASFRGPRSPATPTPLNAVIPIIVANQEFSPTRVVLKTSKNAPTTPKPKVVH